MKVRLPLAAMVATTLALGIGTSALAAEKKGPNKGKPAIAAPATTAAGVESLRTARLLARYGDANKDALALIEAARIVKDVGATQAQAGPAGSKATDTKAKPDLFTVDALVERAQAAASGRPDLIALADDVAKSGARGATGGPRGHREVIATRGTNSFVVTFRGGEPARVAASGDGDSDLDLYVYDENGNLMCKDDDGTDDMYCAWTPRWTGPFNIRVRNRGYANDYTIITN